MVEQSKHDKGKKRRRRQKSICFAWLLAGDICEWRTLLEVLDKRIHVAEVLA
jgi:hypothetical protein